jgi:hypothetical protein
MAPVEAVAAQSVPAQPQLYVLASDVADGRAVWVNPAGLARRAEASVGAFVTATSAAERVRLAQYGLQLASRGFAFGWQHDDLPDGRSSNVYVVSLGLGDDRFALGASRRWYRTSFDPAATWDLGLHVAALPRLDLAAVWRDIGSPKAGDSILEEALILGAATTVLARIRVAGEWQGATSGFVGRKVRVGVTLAVGRGIGFAASNDFSSDPRRRAFALALHVGRPTLRVTAFQSDPAARDLPQTVGLSAMSVAPPPRRRGFPRR